MTTTASPAVTGRTQQDPTRNHARAAGLFYLLTFAASIPAWLMLDPILSDPGYIVGGGHDNQVITACLLDFVNALAAVGSAVAIFPVARRVSEARALGFVANQVGRGGHHHDRRRRPAHRRDPASGRGFRCRRRHL